jgi:hypothetical protein
MRPGQQRRRAQPALEARRDGDFIGRPVAADYRGRAKLDTFFEISNIKCLDSRPPLDFPKMMIIK